VRDSSVSCDCGPMIFSSSREPRQHHSSARFGGRVSRASGAEGLDYFFLRCSDGPHKTSDTLDLFEVW
jgi:hypothetical protein